MTDIDLLRAVLARKDELQPRERDAFQEMLDKLPSRGSLTLRQRDWVQGAAARLGLAGVQQGAAPPPRASAWDPSPRHRKSLGK